MPKIGSSHLISFSFAITWSLLSVLAALTALRYCSAAE